MIAFSRRLAARFTALALAASPMLLPSEAAAVGAMKCNASISDPTPAQNTSIYVNVLTAGEADVRTVAHYKTANTTHHGKANSYGGASISYHIRNAAAGYRVYVDVYVNKPGRSGHCRTSFVPHK